MRDIKMSRAWAEVNLDAIAHNVREIKKLLKPETKIMGVVKADGYGHGFREVAKTLLKNGADALAVAVIDEAIQLRDRGINVPILILGHTPDCRAQDLVAMDITPTVFDETLARAVSDAAVAAGKRAKIHIKIDTGMSRVGFETTDVDLEKILEISRLPNLDAEGIFTHFASADEQDKSYTNMQFERFMDVINRLEEHGLKIPIRHICNSAGIIEFPEYQLDMVRPGIILYGHYPSDCVDRTKLDLRPAMELKAVITHIAEKEKGVKVSYGGIYKTFREKTKIATVPIGYADGYLRNLSNNADMIAGGKRVPVIGRICMDQCMIDVTNVNTINVGDEVVLFGRKGDVEITVTELAELMGTINYEILCVIGKRIPRVYLKDGKIFNVLSYLK